MKYIITEKQYSLISEHTLYTNYLERTSGDEKKTKERQQFFGNVVTEYEKNYPAAFKLTWNLALWLGGGAPGKILVGLIGSILGAKKINEGLKSGDNDTIVEGIIEFITGPASIGMVVRGMKLLGHTGNTYKLLKTIQLSGLPVLIGQGMESFMKWGTQSLGGEFKYFMSLLNNDKGVLSQVLSNYAIIKDKKTGLQQQSNDARKTSLKITDKL